MINITALLTWLPNYSGSPKVYTPNILPIRVVLHGHHPDIKEKEENGGKLAHLPDSVEDLLSLAGEHFSVIIMEYLNNTD